MRLGAYPCKLKPGTNAFRAYNQDLIHERHRHRYEFNMRYREGLERCGIEITGISPDETLVEIIELRDHPWFWAASSTRSSNRSPSTHTRFSGSSSKPR